MARPFAVTKAQRLPHSVRLRLSCATHERQLPVARHLKRTARGLRVGVYESLRL